MNLKVLTVNTWKGDGKYSRRLEWMADQLSKLQPDIILLQEAFQSEGGAHDTARYLGEQLGMDYRFVPARKKTRGVEGTRVMSYSGLACLANASFIFSESLPLPSSKKDGGRDAQVIGIQGEGMRLLIANVHLSFLKDSELLKIAQLKTVLERIAVEETYSHYLIGGDFNSTPQSKTLQFLHSHPNWEVIDTFQHIHPHIDLEKPLAFETMPQSGRRIDYLFSLAKQPEGHLEILNAEIVLNLPDPEGMLASDHFGILTHFRGNL